MLKFLERKIPTGLRLSGRAFQQSAPALNRRAIRFLQLEASIVTTLDSKPSLISSKVG
jgi:hypothetical protein